MVITGCIKQKNPSQVKKDFYNMFYVILIAHSKIHPTTHLQIFH